MTKQQLSAIRSAAGKKGGSAVHKKRGLQFVPKSRRKKIARMGGEARWRDSTV